MMIKIEIQGQDAVLATEEMLAINGLQGSYETINEVEREGVLTTIATIVGLVGGSLTIAEQLYEWKNKYQKSLHTSAQPRIEKVLVVAPNSGKRLLLKDATIENIKKIIED